MISIEQKKSKDVAGNTSLIVKFQYKKEIVEKVKLCDGATYNKKGIYWEVPLSNLPTLLDDLVNFDSIELKVLPETEIKQVQFKLQKYQTTPFEYQLEGIQYGLNHDKFLLLDAPGLGKSLQLIYIAQELKKRKNIEHCLIICGVNTLKTNWKKEIEKHSNLSCRILGERINKKGELVFDGVQKRLKELKEKINEFFVITNLETLRNDDIIKAFKKGPNKFDLIICDEIHTLRNNSSEQGKNFLKLDSPYKIGATGTLLLNNPLDLYVPLKWIGVENCNASTFKYYYCRYGGPFNTELKGYKHTDVLKEELKNYSLRRTKDLLDLPPKTIIDELVDMNPEQEIFYKNIKEGIIDQVDKVHMSVASLLAMISRLRQATACPSILTTEKIKSSKIERCKDLIDQIVSNGEKVVVFSTFKETLNVLQKEIEDYNPLLCTGDIKDSDISIYINRFQTEKENKVMLATWSKMGTGITLTASSNVIFIDCAWTRAQNIQAEDRCYRIGSKSPVFIYYLWCNNTVDLRVKELVEDKSLIADYVVDNEVPPQLLDRLRKIITDL